MVSRVYIPRWFDSNLYKEGCTYPEDDIWSEACHGEQVYVYLDDVPYGAQYIVGTDRYIVDDEEYVLNTFVRNHRGDTEYYSFSYAEVDHEPQ